MERCSHDDEERPSNETLARRFREIRTERFGEGVEVLAERLGIPEMTWRNYEAGIIMPAHILLAFLEITQVNPHWLWAEEGKKFRAPYWLS